MCVCVCNHLKSLAVVQLFDNLYLLYLQRFSVASNLTFPGDSHVKTNVVFDMNDGDHQEHAELSLDAKQYSELTDFELSFEHDPSGFDLASIM